MGAGLVLGAGVLASSRVSAQAATPTPAEPAPPAVEPAPVEEVVESARRSVRSTAEWLARGVDSWFGNKPFEAGGKVTDGRLSLGLLKRQHESVDAGLRFAARFRLPNIEEHTYLFLGRDDPREVITDKPDSFSRQQRLLRENAGDRSFLGGVGLRWADSVDFRIGFRGGLKPYAQARYRRPWQLSAADLVDFRETVFWSVDDHLGSTTALSFEHAFSSTLAARWLNAATITQRVRKFEWSTSLGLYQSYSHQRLLSLEALAGGLQDSGVDVSDYGVQVKWQQPLHKDWLLGELIIGHFWPRPEAQRPRERAWALGGILTMRF
ncbi:MAG: hypothetical protein HY855_01010 [Burkholderiales bacterium]|nr:hypothetical protein [Burkholderiales bacterium]